LIQPLSLLELPPDPDGVNFGIRVAGDRTFAFSTDGGTGGDSAFEQSIRQDLIYDYGQAPAFDPFNPGGPPLDVVDTLFVYPTFKVPGFPCLRIKFRPCLAFSKFICAFLRLHVYRGKLFVSHILDFSLLLSIVSIVLQFTR
jgi:hypothetical protein